MILDVAKDTLRGVFNGRIGTCSAPEPSKHSPAMIFTPSKLAHNALNAAPDAMLIVDAGGLVRYANR